MISQAEKQLSKVRELAERRARYQEKAEAYRQDGLLAFQNFRYWMEEVKKCDESMRQIAAERNGH